MERMTYAVVLTPEERADATDLLHRLSLTATGADASLLRMLSDALDRAPEAITLAPPTLGGDCD